MNTIPAKEIKRRGISAVDELLCKGPVHVIQHDTPKYVIMTEQRYRDLIDAEEEATVARVMASEEDVKAGRVKRYENVEYLIRDLELEPDE
jgi:PHD/YefM family antitoxin component YafN of YafNO toxin-antitoxin module